MADSFFFYDLETSGFNPKDARIVQFAGQRTDLDLKPIGKPYNFLIALSEDVLPDPVAVLVTGITPQQSRAQGLTEAEFLKIFHAEIVAPDTIFTGFNTVRFDDEFMRYSHYRNFYDPYEWQWQEGRSRWDLLDVVRMTRALRPEGIKWPVDSTGRPSCRLELMTAINNLDHNDAHDALSDVNATLALARLVKNKQPKLFDFLLSMRQKNMVAELVNMGQPFIYTSGKYDHECQKTTIVHKLADHPKRKRVLVYDLRQDPGPFLKLSPLELAEAWRWKKDSTDPRLPVKTLQFNRCPAIAPLSVLDSASKERLSLDLAQIKSNLKILQNNGEFISSILQALELLDEKQQARLLETDDDVDARLYEGFFGDLDKTKMSIVRAADGDDLVNLDVKFKDQRLQALLLLYKARNFPKYLTEKEHSEWNAHKERKLTGGNGGNRLADYFKQIEELKTRQGISPEQNYILDELMLYGQSIMPLGSE